MPQQTPAAPSSLHPPRRPRASKACISCHTRKIRCDALQVGFPCSQCKANNFDCAVATRKKRRRKGDVLKLSTGHERAARLQSIPEHIMLHQVPHYPFIRGFQPRGHQWLQAKDNENGVLLPVSGSDQSPFTSQAQAVETGIDIDFLHSKGALELPTQEVLNKCIAIYFELFHPFFPVIDKPVFLKQYHQFDRDALLRRQGPSLLLLHAITFASISMLPRETIHGMGYSSKKQARSTLHKKALYLHKLDFEPDDIVTIQALLLLSHHYSSMVDQRHTWFWVHQAICLAQGIGLHRDPGDVPQRKLWARIWWACLVRDRLISLGTGRPMHISSLNCNVRMLDMEDLEEDRDTDQDNAIKSIFVQLIKLCQYMEGVLSLQLVPTSSLSEQIQICDFTLQKWISNLPPEAHHMDDNSDRGPIARLYRSLLHLIYNVVVISLQQHEEKTTAHNEDSQCFGSRSIQLIAGSSVDLLRGLLSQDLVRLCPTQIVTTIIPPLIVHLMLMRNSNSPRQHEASKSDFEICMNTLEQLGEIYWHASFYHDFFKLAALHVDSLPRLKGAADPHNDLLQNKQGTNQGIIDDSSGAESVSRSVDDHPLPEVTNLERSSEIIGSASGGISIGTLTLSPLEDLNIKNSERLGSSSAHFDTFAEWLNLDECFQSFFPSA